MGITRSVFMDKGSEVPHLGMALGFRLGLQKSIKPLPFLGLFLISRCASGRAKEELVKPELQPPFPAEPEWESVLSSPECVPVTRARHCARAQLCSCSLILVGSAFSRAPGHGIRGAVLLSPLLSGYRLSLSRSKQPIGATENPLNIPSSEALSQLGEGFV